MIISLYREAIADLSSVAIFASSVSCCRYAIRCRRLADVLKEAFPQMKSTKKELG